MRTEITAGQTSDYLGFDLVMADNLPEPSVLLADRGYDSDNIRKTMEVRDVVPVIPMRKTRKLRVAVDRRLYRLRNLVERCFNKLKNARRVATRYDKTAESFPGFIDITSIRLWLRHLSTWPISQGEGVESLMVADAMPAHLLHSNEAPRRGRINHIQDLRDVVARSPAIPSASQP